MVVLDVEAEALECLLLAEAEKEQQSLADGAPWVLRCAVFTESGELIDEASVASPSILDGVVTVDEVLPRGEEASAFRATLWLEELPAWGTFIVLTLAARWHGKNSPQLRNWGLVVARKGGAAVSELSGAGPWPETQSALIIGVLARTTQGRGWRFGERKRPISSGTSLASFFAAEELSFARSVASGSAVADDSRCWINDGDGRHAERRLEELDKSWVDDHEMSFASDTSLNSLRRQLGTNGTNQRTLSMNSSSVQQESLRLREELKKQETLCENLQRQLALQAATPSGRSDPSRQKRHVTSPSKSIPETYFEEPHSKAEHDAGNGGIVCSPVYDLNIQETEDQTQVNTAWPSEAMTKVLQSTKVTMNADATLLMEQFQWFQNETRQLARLRQERDDEIAALERRLSDSQRRVSRFEREVQIKLQAQHQIKIAKEETVSGNDDVAVKEDKSCWRLKAEALAEQVKRKGEKVQQLHHRELWFEAQLKRQMENNEAPMQGLREMVADVRAQLSGGRPPQGLSTVALPSPTNSSRTRVAATNQVRMGLQQQQLVVRQGQIKADLGPPTPTPTPTPTPSSVAPSPVAPKLLHQGLHQSASSKSLMVGSHIQSEVSQTPPVSTNASPAFRTGRDLGPPQQGKLSDSTSTIHRRIADASPAPKVWNRLQSKHDAMRGGAENSQSLRESAGAASHPQLTGGLGARAVPFAAPNNAVEASDESLTQMWEKMRRLQSAAGVAPSAASARAPLTIGRQPTSVPQVANGYPTPTVVRQSSVPSRAVGNQRATQAKPPPLSPAPGHNAAIARAISPKRILPAGAVKSPVLRDISPTPAAGAVSSGSVVVRRDGREASKSPAPRDRSPTPVAGLDRSSGRTARALDRSPAPTNRSAQARADPRLSTPPQLRPPGSLPVSGQQVGQLALGPPARMN